LLSIFGEGEHQPFCAGALHVPRLDSRCAHDERQGFPAGCPFDGRAGDLDVRDGPVLLYLAPQSKDDWTSAKHFLSSLPREHILEFDVIENGLGFGQEIKDHFVTVACTGLHDHFLDLRFSNGTWAKACARSVKRT
jgi:hypothetical protein